jgi:glutamate:GABA antiporter
VTFLSRTFFVEKEVEIVITTRQQTRQDEDQRRLKRVPLRSEVAIPQVMPPVFKTGDLIALFLLNVFWVTNITPIAAGGPAGFLYWIVCGGAFFIPCSLVMAQLARMFPHEGSILSWTAHALGARWSFFVGICAWLPGILSIVNAAAACISWVQALNSQWLTQPWQQGLAILVVLSFTGVLACQRTRMVQNVLNIAVCAMGVSTVLIVLAAGVWLASGHHAATSFATSSTWAITPANFALLGSATLALLGSDMPLALAGEVAPRHQRRAFSLHLTWGTICTLGGYLLFTFAVLVVQGAGVASHTVNPMVLLIGTVDQVFGKTVGDVMALGLGLYFFMIPVALHLCFSRLLLVASLDRHISIWFAALNRQRVPLHAIVSQIGITIGAALLIYFLVPSLSFLGKPGDLSNIAYNVIGASLLLVWAVSFLFPFLDVVVLYFKDRPLFQEAHILPLPLLFPVLVGCCITGVGLCLLTIGFTLSNSFIPTLIPNANWWYIIGGSALGGLILFAAFSLLTSSEAQWEEMRHSA